MAQLNEKIVGALKAPSTGNKIYPFSGATLQGVTAPGGFGICVTAAGARSFILNYRHQGTSRRLFIGRWPTWSALQAVKEARELRRAVDRGEDPLGTRRKAEAVAENTFKNLCEDYFKRGGATLRTLDARKRDLERLAYPVLGNRPVESIRRSEIIRLLDGVAENAPVMADRLLASIRRILNWHAARSDDYVSPIVRGMARNASKSRERILTDDEIRRIWTATGTFPAAYHALVKFLLLTGARRGEVAEMPWAELADGVWTLPPARNKVDLPLVRPLSSAALAVLPPRSGQFVFSLDDGQSPLVSFSLYKAVLDQACGVSGWTVHDLRRTARSLMSRAKVPTDHAERCLGHVMPKIRATYDKYEYFDEKAAAYRALAGLIDRIVDPQDNVRALRRG
jgi:integrase